LEYDEIPVMDTGKYDYKAIMIDVNQENAVDQSLFSKAKTFVLEALGLLENDWDSVLELFAKTLTGMSVTDSDSFDHLGGDSLSYVSLSIELEDLLGSHFPTNWTSLSIQDLEILYQKKLSE